MKSYPWCCGHHPVGEDKQIQAYQLENVLKEPNDLQSEHILDTEKHRRVTREAESKYMSSVLQSAGERKVRYLSTVISHFKDGRLPANPA